MKKIFALLLALALVVCTAGCGGEKAVNKSKTAAQVNNTAVSSDESGKYDEYPYDIEADKKNFDFKNIDIVVGDKLYMTQINDWFQNFGDYAGKSVEIEGYYMTFDGSPYTYVGRLGPSCQYCTGGYVNFEFKTDEDLSAYTSEKTWVTVTGILREGTAHDGKDSASFYYIEVMSIKDHLLPGVDTVTD